MKIAIALLFLSVAGTLASLQTDAEYLIRMFEQDRTKNFVDIWAKDAVLDQRGMPGPIGRKYIGTTALQEFISQVENSIQFTDFKWKVVNVDEARATSLVHFNMAGTMTQTQRKFTVKDHYVLFEWQNHKVIHAVGWIEDQASYESMNKAYKTKAQETVEQMFENYFNGKVSEVKSSMGSTQISNIGNTYNPFIGKFSFEQAMRDWMPKVDMEISDIKFAHVSQNDVIVLVRYSKMIYRESGKSFTDLEDFMDKISITVSDDGHIAKYSVTCFPQAGVEMFYSAQK